MIFQYKDCQHACKNGNADGGKNGCNNDLYSVARKFRPDPEHPVTEGKYDSFPLPVIKVMNLRPLPIIVFCLPLH